MDSYEILWKHQQNVNYEVLTSSTFFYIIEAVESLVENPFPSQCCKLTRAKNLYRIRVGDYRVIYQVDPRKKSVIIYYIRHRKRVYKNLK